MQRIFVIEILDMCAIEKNLYSVSSLLTLIWSIKFIAFRN